MVTRTTIFRHANLNQQTQPQFLCPLPPYSFCVPYRLCPLPPLTAGPLPPHAPGEVGAKRAHPEAEHMRVAAGEQYAHECLLVA